MANWIALTINDIKDAVHGSIVDAAQSSATGTDDPVASTIQDVVARIRASISPGNTLDADISKIPRSLKSIAARMCARALKQRIQMELNQDERDQRKEDNDYLKQLYIEKVAFEEPDTPAGVGEMQQTGDRIEQTSGAPVDTPGAMPTQMSRTTLEGL